MSKGLKRQVAFSLALVGCLLGFWLSRGTGLLEVLFAVAACGVVIFFVIAADEVERLLALQASASSFAALLTGAVIASVARVPSEMFVDRHDAWAVMIFVFLVFWTALRVRLG